MKDKIVSALGVVIVELLMTAIFVGMVIAVAAS